MAEEANKLIERRFLDLVSDGNVVELCKMVSPEWRMHTGFNGLQTDVGREQKFTAIFIHRIKDGKIQESWRNADYLGRVLQLGARIVPGDHN